MARTGGADDAGLDPLLPREVVLPDDSHGGHHEGGETRVIRFFAYDRIMDQSEVIKGLAALAHPVRLQVFRALVVTGSSGLTPGTIQEALKVAPATLSFHLKELVSSGLVTQERIGRNLIYRAAYEHMNGLLGYLTENCCQGAECAVQATPDLCVC